MKFGTVVMPLDDAPLMPCLHFHYTYEYYINIILIVSALLELYIGSPLLSYNGSI
jgi:hypothetical protein